jgi:hypothetical protein
MLFHPKSGIVRRNENYDPYLVVATKMARKKECSEQMSMKINCDGI